MVILHPGLFIFKPKEKEIMRKRTTKVRDHAAVVKVKCWRRLVAIALDEEINLNSIAAMEAVINLAEPSDIEGGHE